MKLATWKVQRLTRTTSVRMSGVRPYLDAINADIWVLTETGEDVSPGPGYQGVATTEFDRASHDPGRGVDEDLVALAHRAFGARL